MSNKDKSSGYSPIQCQFYDYIEIACMRHYRLDIELTSGETLSGKALTTRIKDKQEFIVISADSEKNHEEQEIRLDLVKSITALDNNAEFKTVVIN